MSKWVYGVISIAVVAILGVVTWLWTPAPPGFDAAAARDAAQQYKARIIRDRFGAPHIYGERDADVGFGLAYAHAEDDWETIEEVLFFSRGVLARHRGKVGAIPDYLVASLGVWSDIEAKYETDLAPETRELVEAYAAGLNLFCAENRKRCAKGAAPVSGKDIVAGFVSRAPFFYGLDDQLTKLFEGNIESESVTSEIGESFLRLPEHAELGSNAMAVAPKRSTDGHTRLMVNSHQPYTGPVAWYEARVKSNEGWDMIGGLFPGAPMILLGAGPALGWAHTVNRPDLVDIYRLEVDDGENPTQYRFDGEWRRLETTSIRFRVKLFGRFSLPVKRKAYRSLHGPVFKTDNGVFSVAYGGAGDIRSAEQWFRMNKARNYDEWRAAMEMVAIPSLNTIYADGDGKIAYFYNAAFPVRTARDWSVVAPGDDPELLWQGVRPFKDAPNVIDPVSGYIVNGNNSPFEASGPTDNPDANAFPPHIGVDRRTTNRGARLQALYGSDEEISEDEFLAYKFDHIYGESSRIRRFISALVGSDAVRSDETLIEAAKLLANWEGSVGVDDRAATLAILTAQKVQGFLLDEEAPDMNAAAAALKETVSALEKGFGRMDPTWGEAVRLKRGNVDLPINGGPDTLRAVYPVGDPGDGPLTASFGDTYILYADWSELGDITIKTIHQFGAATQDATSVHYDDQAPIFAAEEWKTPPMQLQQLLKEARADYHVGAR